MKNHSNEPLFEALFNQTATPITVIKANPPIFTIVAINEQFKLNSRTSTTDAIGKSAFDVFKPWDEAGSLQFKLLIKGLLQAIDDRRPVDLPVLQFNSPSPDGASTEQSWWQINIKPVFIGTDEVAYLMCSTFNITKQEQTRLAIEAAKHNEMHLQQELQQINGVLSTKNHELLLAIEELRKSKIDLHQLNKHLEQRIKKRTTALKESEQRFKSILDALPQIAWTNTLEGEVDFYNKRWYDYTGLNFEETKEWGWKQVIHPDDLQFNLDTYSKILKSNQPGEFEVRERGKDGNYRCHLVRLQPLAGQSGKIKRWIGTATDIEEIKKLQQQKDDFISIASHELKTPITSLQASLQLLDRMKDNPAPEIFTKLISQARKSMQKVSTLVNDLLNVGRIQKGQLPLNKTVFLISELINSCCNPVSIAGKHHIHIEGNKKLLVHADLDRVDQVIVNLVNNAIKYAPNSTNISIIIEEKDGMAKITVKDYGAGIPEDKIVRLFDPYFRLDSATYHASGLGLGLYICSEIIKRHGGQIGVESELGKGSAFWFTLPLGDQDNWKLEDNILTRL